MRDANGAPVRARTPHDIAALCADIRQSAQEAFIVIDLNAKNNVIDKRLVTLGLLDASLVHPREVLSRRNPEQRRRRRCRVTTTRPAIRPRAPRTSASPASLWTPAGFSQSAFSITLSSAAPTPPAPAPPASSACAKPALSHSPIENHHARRTAVKRGRKHSTHEHHQRSQVRQPPRPPAHTRRSGGPPHRLRPEGADRRGVRDRRPRPGPAAGRRRGPGNAHRA